MLAQRDGDKAYRMRLRFRAILTGDGCVHPGSVHDAISARIAERLGFEAAMFAGSVASLAVLGAPDVVVLTLTEFAEQARRICRAAELPLLVDADHGYGNALSVMRTVEELENAGVAALTIEDTALPAPFGATATSLLSIDEGKGKIAAALEARDDPSLAVIARTGAMSIGGVNEAVARARAYAALGPDALFFTGVAERAHLDALTQATSLPIVLGSAPAKLGDRSALAASRVRLSLQGHKPFMASVQAMYDTLKALRDGTAPGDIGGAASEELLRETTRADDYEEWARRFLGA